MTLEEVCGFLGDLLGVHMFVIHSGMELETFLQQVRFHRIQSCLNPDVLSAFLDGLEENHLISLNDDFQIRLLLGRLDGKAFLFGPYCCESLSRWEARVLLERCGISGEFAQDLLAYRSAFPILSGREVLRTVRIAMHHAGGCKETPPVRTVDLQRTPVQSVDSPVEQPYAEAVNNRYAIERDMMDAVEQGNAERALSDWRQLHQRMNFRKKQLGASLEISRISAAVTRTVLRLAGMRTGLPAVVLDQITQEIAHRNHGEKTAEGIETNTEDLIHCQQLRLQIY